MIIFMGVAGSGKSTMGHLLAAHLHCPWVSTGNLLRQKMDAKTQQEMLRGKIISDDQTLEVLDEEFRRIGAAQNQFILDGSPRTMRQAQWLAEKAQAGELKITATIHLKVSLETAKQRLLARQRPDDHDQAIAERFREYESSVKPILDFLNKEGYKIHEINASQKPQEVAADIQKALGVYES
jgi:adenylate kinase